MPQSSNTTALQICNEEHNLPTPQLCKSTMKNRSGLALSKLISSPRSGELRSSFIEEDLDATVYSSGSLHQSSRSKHNTTNGRHEELEDLGSLNPHGISPVSTRVDPKQLNLELYRGGRAPLPHRLRPAEPPERRGREARCG
jgi:hypothetical protein